MAPTTQVDSDIESQLKSAIYLMVSKMVEQDLTNIDKEISATPTFVASLVELVYNQLLNLGEDLELFANHAGRSTIKPADLYMVTRKNDILTNVLREFEVNEMEKE